jgi:hypothetical protein
MRPSPFSFSYVLILGALYAAPAAWVQNRPDLARIERAIDKEPHYLCDQPLYGLLAFGPRAETRAWIVLDKSSPEGPYDLVYFDLNGNGDLTDLGERLAPAETSSDGKRCTFRIAKFKDRTSGNTHRIELCTGKDDVEHLLVYWRGTLRISCGFDVSPLGVFGDWKSGPPRCFSDRPDTAPILWPGAEEPLEVVQRHAPGTSWHVGRETRVFAMLGHRGLGRSSFCAISNDYLRAGLSIQATLTCTRADGGGERVQVNLGERCCGYLYHSVLPVPAAARPGPASLRLDIPGLPRHTSVPVQIPVRILKPLSD